MSRARAIAPIVAVALAVGVSMSAGVEVGPGRAVEALPSPAPAPARPELVPAEKLRKAVRARDAYRTQVRELRTTLRTGPDFEISLQLAAIAYGQSWRAMYACALSEGARRAERYARLNTRPSADGLGSIGPFQFLRSTFITTPYAHLDWARQDVQAAAAAWMWSRGRRGEWYGVDC